MLWAIAGVLVGWVIMTVLAMAAFITTPFVLGFDGTFQADSYWTTDTPRSHRTIW